MTADTVSCTSSCTHQIPTHGYTIEWVDAELHRLKAIRNTLIPIMRLPAEVLTRIIRHSLSAPRFKYAPHIDYDAREDCSMIVKMTSVCAHWRQVLIADHGLWSVLPCSDLHEKLFATFVQRTGKHSVSVNVIERMDFNSLIMDEDDEDGDENIDESLRFGSSPPQETLNMIEQNLTCALKSGCSIKKLEVEIKSEEILPVLRRAMELNSSSLQGLQVLRVDWDHSEPLYHMDQLFPSRFPPLLEYLELNCCDYRWANLASLRNLRCLKLIITGESAHALIDLEGWRNVLSDLSDNLESFVLCQWSGQQVPPTHVLPSDLNRLKGQTPVRMQKLREFHVAMEGAACLASQIKGLPLTSIELSDKIEDWDAVVQVFNQNFTPLSSSCTSLVARYELGTLYYSDESEAPILRLQSCDNANVRTTYLNFDARLAHAEDFICRLAWDIRSCIVHLHLENSSDLSKPRPYDYQRMTALLPEVTTISINVSYNPHSGGQKNYILLPEWATCPSVAEATFPKVKTLNLDGANLEVGSDGASAMLLDALRNRMKLQLPIMELRMDERSRMSDAYKQEVISINPQCSVIVIESPQLSSESREALSMDIVSDHE